MSARASGAWAVQRFRGGGQFFHGLTAADPPIGSTSMSFVLVLQQFSFLNLGVTFVSHATNQNTNGGWQLSRTGDNIRLQVAQTGPVELAVSTPCFNQRQVLQVVVAAYDGAQSRIRALGVTVTAAAGVGGYAVPQAGHYLTIGGRVVNNDNPSRFHRIVAFMGTDSVALSLAEMADLETDLYLGLENGRSLEEVWDPTGLIYYDAEDAITPAAPWGTPTVGTWAPRVGPGVTLTPTGPIQAAQAYGFRA